MAPTLFFCMKACVGHSIENDFYRKLKGYAIYLTSKIFYYE